MDQFFKTHKLPVTKLNQDKIRNLNISKTIKEIRFIIENFPQKKSPSPDGLTEEFCQILKE